MPSRPAASSPQRSSWPCRRCSSGRHAAGSVNLVGAAALAFFCTAVAYILYFRLIANAGPANAVAVTYLVPIFAVAWGGLFLGETLSWSLVAGCAVVFIGTALATGVVRPRLRLGPARPA